MQSHQGAPFFQFFNTEKKGGSVATDPWQALARAIVAEEETPAASEVPAFRPGERVCIDSSAPWWWLHGATGVVVGCYGPQVLVRPDGWRATFGCRPGDLVREKAP